MFLVIVTSRDMHVLISGGIHGQHIHQVRELNFEESLELFSLNAFKQSHPKKEYEELSYMTVAYARGIPLALKVLGSHFYSRDKIYWESELSKLRKCPKREIQNVFKVSYDGLDDVEKEIFLDIAFFFVGEQKHKVTQVLDGCDFNAISGIDNLVDKALIKILDSDIIQMHDLIREMAEQIVREESIKYPEGRSRLNNPKEVYNLLKNNMGTNKIEGLMFNMSQIKDLQLHCDTFTKMRKLRILNFYYNYWGWHMRSNLQQMGCNIKIPFGLEFPNELRYFRWDQYPLESLPLGFCPENLVELDMKRSKLKKLWDGTEDIVNLKRIDLGGSKQLMELPDFSMAHKLETINLGYCTSLHHVYPSILSLHSLIKLDVSGCSKLESIESETHLDSLSVLQAFGCDSLEKFCLSSEKMTHIELTSSEIKILHFPNSRLVELQMLRVSGQRLKSLPINELCGLTKLEQFKLIRFKHVIEKMELENLFDALRYLCHLDLSECSKLSEIPENIGALTRLRFLSLAETNVESLPASMEHLSSLIYIHLRNCRKLRSILGLPPLLIYLDASECISLETVISSTPVQQKLRDNCCFKFYNCVKLDEPSLSCIRELTHSSLLLARKDRYYRNVACYPGSEVPMQMPYKQTTEASNTVEFTCDLHQLCGFMLCCVLSQFTLRKNICYDSNDVDNKYKFYSFYQDLGAPDLNSDHVFLWYSGYESANGRTSDHGKFTFEFYTNECVKDSEFSNRRDLIKACGVCPIYASEMERKRERDNADIDVEERLPSTKKLRNHH